MPARTFTSTYYCDDCTFTTRDINLIKNHSCEVQEQGGTCEDYPCCGHEWGDCNGLKYGSDEAIKENARNHFDCEHEHGLCNFGANYEDGDDDE